MPAALTYPGVYLEELSSGVRTITGVATSIAAFVGWAPKGPVDRAELVLGWADYERKFGGLHAGAMMSYSVMHFFNNGGNRAYIVRVVAEAAPPAPEGEAGEAAEGEVPEVIAADVATATTTAISEVPSLVFEANSPGGWGNALAVAIKPRTAPADRFQLAVLDMRDAKDDPAKGVAIEVFENLSSDASDQRFVGSVLRSESRLIALREVVQAPAEDEAPVEGEAPAEGEAPVDKIVRARFDHGEDGDVLDPVAQEATFVGALKVKEGDGARGVRLLDRVDLFNLLCVPGLTDATAISDLQAFCRRKRAFLIADCSDVDFEAVKNGPASGLTQADAINAAQYFPWVVAPDPLQQGRSRSFPPCGFVAGLFARTDAERGVWKAPAGTEASLTGVIGARHTLTDDENGELNPRALNCIRNLPIYGTVLWGARTLHGNDERGSEWKYVPVRRTALFLEESLYRALKWVVFEPNDEPLWSQIRLNVGAFMQDLFRQGAFQGKSSRDAYFVKCDSETTTQSDINRGVVNIMVGFAPLKPAEFVVIKIQQIAGQIET